MISLYFSLISARSRLFTNQEVVFHQNKFCNIIWSVILIDFFDYFDRNVVDIKRLCVFHMFYWMFRFVCSIVCDAANKLSAYSFYSLRIIYVPKWFSLSLSFRSIIKFIISFLWAVWVIIKERYCILNRKEATSCTYCFLFWCSHFCFFLIEFNFELQNLLILLTYISSCVWVYCYKDQRHCSKLDLRQKDCLR